MERLKSGERNSTLRTKWDSVRWTLVSMLAMAAIAAIAFANLRQPTHAEGESIAFAARLR
jgi:hypothetical protein